MNGAASVATHSHLSRLLGFMLAGFFPYVDFFGIEAVASSLR